MRKILMALILVTGCGAGADQANEAVEKQDSVAAGGLTGLYESAGPRPNQLCIVDKGAEDASFGLVVWGANLHSCSGAGSVTREGNRLTLAMAGDQSCTIQANIEGDTITLPAFVPEGCSYYCGAQARLTGASFEKKGSSVEDALKATDLVGEPLCTAAP